jgi:hypothetical protein
LEEPSPDLADELCAGGFLWNSFVLVANTASLLTLFARAWQAFLASFACIRPLLGNARGREMLEAD